MDSTSNIILIVGLVILLIALAAFTLWIWMLIHVITKNNTETQIVWLVAMVVFGPIVSLIYYFVVKRPMDAEILKSGAKQGATSFK